MIPFADISFADVGVLWLCSALESRNVGTADCSV